MNLSNIPDNDLRAEVARREAEKEAARRRLLDAHHELILAHIDTLLLFRPAHNDHGCDDINHNNAQNCGRCILLDIKHDQMVWPENLEVELEILRNTEGYS